MQIIVHNDKAVVIRVPVRTDKLDMPELPDNTCKHFWSANGCIDCGFTMDEAFDEDLEADRV